MLFLAVIVLMCIGTFIAPRFGWQVDVVYSGSMEPSMKQGSLAVVQPVDTQDIRVGDVVTYKSGTESDMPTAHRVVEVVNDDSLMFRTKGDNNEDPDIYAVPAEDVLGRVWLSAPYVGYAIDFIKKPLGFGLLISIPIALKVGIELKNKFSTVRALRRKGHTRQAST